MHISTLGLVCALLPHGEHGAVVRFLTPDHGLVAGYVRGGRSRRQRPVLQPGNKVDLRLDARTDSQLPAAVVELISARAALATTGLALAALDWLTTLTAATLSEAVPHPALYAALDALTAAIAAGAGAVPLGEGIVRYEHRLLAELGFGLDIASCASTGTTSDLAYVSPKSSQAVSRGAGLPWAARLLPLPGFLIGDTPADVAAIHDGLKLTGYFLRRDLAANIGQTRDIWPARDRFIARLPVA